jgi:undecaprenyl-diphosphatase
MYITHAVILGIVEGVTEFLPISSTGHLILAAQALKLPQSDFVKSFEIIIQLGAICSVIALYYKSLFLNWKIARRLIAAFIPTGIVGFLLYSLVRRFLMGNSQVVLWSLLAGGVCLIVFELLHREKAGAQDDVASISYGQAVAIGLFQSVAVVPGVSRAAATILGGLLVGLKRRTIVEFSFLLAVPTMLAATVLEVSKNTAVFDRSHAVILLVGFITSFIVALCAVKFLLAFIRKHNFIVFGVYRMLIAILFLFIVIL